MPCNNSIKKHQLESLEPSRLRKVRVSQRGKDPLSGSKDLCRGGLTSVEVGGKWWWQGGLSGK